jgi:membrane-associated phospholipid phosphatase
MYSASILASLSFINTLKSFDYWFFTKINGEWHTPFLDNLLPLCREAIFWLPFYIFLILFVTINYKRKGWYWVIFFIMIAAVSDFLSSSIIKEYFFRIRPCHDILLMDKIRFLASYCPQSSSFTSSHAVNHFAISMFIFMTFRNAISKWWALIFIWAIIICYAQVYVGVHFPLDVFGGGIVGALIGYITSAIFNKKIGLLSL